MKRSQGTLKRTTLKKKPLTEEQKKERSENIQKMWKLYNEHWELKTRRIYDYVGHICESCEEQILGENKSLYHDHLLEKGNSQYKHLKYDINNLFLCCSECHSKKTNGIPTEPHKIAIEAAKRRYNVQ